jgi:hypothetical protein
MKLKAVFVIAATKAGDGQYADLTELFCTTNPEGPAITGQVHPVRDRGAHRTGA